MAIKKSQLYSTLWESCNALRGSMDASQYKDYVLMILFVKYLSDKAKKGQIDLTVPEGCYFEDFVALKMNDHIGDKINQKLEAIREANMVFIGDMTLPNFNDDAKLGTGRTKVDTLSNLIGEFEREELDFSQNRAADDDLLGDAYEYLMKNFAVESGKSKGQFYTPAEVSRVMAKVLHMEDFLYARNTIYDMTCGSGSLLLRALGESPHGNLKLYGQEKDSTTASLAKLNMLLHGVVNADIKIGDTLKDPQFKTGTMVDTFDVCVANPPFSLKNWRSAEKESDEYNRWNPSLLPPTKWGDFAFLLHFIHSMKPDTGRGACILPHGVLFRGNTEYTIRKHIVDKHYFKGIIGLPPNLFFGTNIPACILILDKKDVGTREGIFFIDAKDGFMKSGNMNRLREQDIKRILDAWNNQEDIPHYARKVKWEEIENNDYNLNISRYIQPRDTEIQQDIDAHLHGGLPQHDIDKMSLYWEMCPGLKNTLFVTRQDSRYDLKIDKVDIANTISNNDSFIQQKSIFEKSLEDWKNEVCPLMEKIGIGCRPKELIDDWSERLLSISKADASIVDAYAIYDHLMNYWTDTMQDDCYMISNDGWTFTCGVPTSKDKSKDKSKKKGKNNKSTYKDIVCDLLPVDVLLREFFEAERKEISQIEQKIVNYQSNIYTLVEEESEVFADVIDDGENINESTVKKAIKSADVDTLKVLNKYLDLCKKKKEVTTQLNVLQDALTIKIEKKYLSLKDKEEDIRYLVVHKKWLYSIISSCRNEMRNITKQLTTEVTNLVTRYETTLSELDNDVKQYEDEVRGYLKKMGFEL